MAARHEDLEWFRELLAPLGGITIRRMFGGAGFYADGLMIAIEAGGSLYLKVDAATRPRFEAEGCAAFVYTGGEKPIAMSYWSAPDEAMDSPDAMRPWARYALEAAQRAAAAKRPSKRAKSGVTAKAAHKAAAKAAQKRAPSAASAASRKSAAPLSASKARTRRARTRKP